VGDENRQSVTDKIAEILELMSKTTGWNAPIPAQPNGNTKLKLDHG
jgi:hypothetical protein